MSLTSTAFLYLFLPLCAAVYYVIPCRKTQTPRNLFLLGASFVFYAWGQAMALVLILGLTAAVWLLGLLVSGRKKTRLGKALVFFTVLINVGALFVYKYLDFTLDNVGKLVGRQFEPTGLALPMGLSFFCFQAISYVVDIYRGKAAARKNPLETALYLAVFFKVTSGPIMQYNQFEKQIRERETSLAKFTQGVWRFAIGLGKKTIIASNVGYLVSEAFGGEATMSAALAWLGSLGYMLQIYYDFSGYSDMALGLALIFGFDIPENFDYPYTATSITNYWQKWHITLGGWFRDYMFYPLTLGPAIKLRKRILKKHSKKTAKFAQNFFVTSVIWITTGIWHGATWNYLVWGLVNFVFILWELYRKPFKNKKLDSVFGHTYTLLVCLLTKPLVHTPDLGAAAGHYLAMLGVNVPAATGYDGFLLREYALILIIAAVGCFPWYRKLKEKLGQAEKTRLLSALRVAEAVGVAAVFVLSVVFMQQNGSTAFIYQRF